jgi:hypothetical protein
VCHALHWFVSLLTYYQKKHQFIHFFFQSGTLPWLHLLESPGMVGDYKRYFRNLRPHVGLPQLFGAIFETILNAGNRVNHHRIWALLKSANADLGDEKLIEPCAWMVGFYLKFQF